MTRRSRWLLVGLAAAIAGGWFTHHELDSHAPDAGSGSDVAHHRTVGPDFVEALAVPHGRSAKISGGASHPGDDGVDVTGAVIEVRDHHPVANVEVVFRSPLGEASTTTGSDGSYRIHVAVGVYRAFVRDDSVLSVGVSDRVRLPGMPSVDTAGAPDEALMPLVIASADVQGIDLSVTRGGRVEGHVVDRSGHPIAGAVLRARGRGLRPALGTDIAESDAQGAFELRLPAGEYEIDATHARFAGVANPARLMVEPGDKVGTTLTLTAGCVIAGRVLGHDGKAAGDGAIEKQWGTTDSEFGPTGRIEPDGAFRWFTTEEVDVVLRAWPWKSPHSPSHRFSCRDGARFENIVFQLPDQRPDIEGVLVDKAGSPVPFTFVDLAPLDDGGTAQQERTDVEGHWQVYDMPAGRYRVTAQAPDRGIVVATVASPRDGVRLVLGGTGRLEGTTTNLASGSFELSLDACVDGSGSVPLPRQHRIVTVEAGHFAIDNVVACDVMYAGNWHGHPAHGRVVIPDGGTAHVTLALGPPHEKTVEGMVRDRNGAGIANALVTSTLDEHTATAKTDADGHYSLKSFSGASLYVANGSLEGHGAVGEANIDTEQVDLQLGPEIIFEDQ